MRPLNIRAILVASDLQESSDTAVRSAALLAERLGAALHLVHAVDIPAVGYKSLGVMMDFQRQIQEARRALREQIERSVPNAAVVASQQIRMEPPPRAINDRATEVGADLIVLGPHRPQAFRGPILGNTADRVLRSAAVPVLLVPDMVSLPLRRVVVPIDLSDPARGALDQALIWTETLADNTADPAAPAQVRVLHVIPKLYQDYDFPFDRAVVVPELQSEIDGAVGRVGGGGGLRIEQETVWGNAPAEEIVRYVEAGGADLLVMGTHGYGAIGRALIGSITSRVARAAPCPILLVPPALWNADETARAVPIEVEVSEPPVPVT